jgi:hypothetical protein
MSDPVAEKRPVKVCIATPVYGPPASATVSYAYHAAMLSLLRDAGIGFVIRLTNCDLVRARSRAVYEFLQTDATHLLFWDEDTIPPSTQAIGWLVHSGHDMIGLPYPHKKLDWEAVADGVRDEHEQSTLGRQTGADLEALSQTMPLFVKSADGGVEGGIGEVECMGFGFMMLSRSCCERMVEAYRKDLTFTDLVDGRKRETVALFQLIIRADRILLSEDYSFCERWRAIGGKVMVMAAPASHVGRHVYRGQLGALVG